MKAFPLKLTSNWFSTLNVWWKTFGNFVKNSIYEIKSEKFPCCCDFVVWKVRFCRIFEAFLLARWWSPSMNGRKTANTDEKCAPENSSTKVNTNFSFARNKISSDENIKKSISSSRKAKIELLRSLRFADSAKYFLRRSLTRRFGDTDGGTWCIQVKCFGWRVLCFFRFYFSRSIFPSPSNRGE